MKYRTLGNSELDISVIGLGTWAIGGPDWEYGWGSQEDRESIQTIHKAVDNGINWLDTAAVYGLGHSETVVGKALKEMSEKPYVFTKCARTWNDNREIGHNLKKESVKKECEDSLRRLGVDVIDVYQVHWPVPDEDIEEGWTAIAELIEEGKVRYAGTSNFSKSQLQRVQSIHPVISLQPPYSMLVRDIEKEIMPYCGEENIGMICYSPMYKGLLTGKMTRERVEAFDENDHRSRDPRFKEPELTANLNLVEGLKTIADRNDKSVLHLAIAWTLRRPEMTAAIVGARRPDQIEGIIPAGDWELSGKDIDEIDVLLKQRNNDLS